ncbi:MAG: hypothetical protein K8T89_01385 [Planctomycetes bacterium]|nr:hypothetical protein [Planctomycetota bacterium]
MAAKKVKIIHPERDSERMEVPISFAVIGLARGDINKVRGTITNLQDGSSADGTAIKLQAKPVKYLLEWKPSGGFHKWWAIKFDATTAGGAGTYKLEVFGVDANGVDIPGCKDKIQRVEVVNALRGVRATSGVDVLYPTANQNVIEERDYFVVYGTRTAGAGTAVTNVTVTPSGAGAIAYGDFFDDGDSFWAATFNLSSLEPDLDLVATIAGNGVSGSQQFCINS